MRRRQLLASGAATLGGPAAWVGASATIAWAPEAAAQVVNEPAPEALLAALLAFTGGVPVRDGRVSLDISPLVENGNTVPVSISVPSVPAAEVRRLALFTERNPQPEVVVFELGPLAGRAVVATRIRLATSQTVVAMAQLADGSCWQQRREVVVTLAACVEGG